MRFLITLFLTLGLYAPVAIAREACDPLAAAVATTPAPPPNAEALKASMARAMAPKAADLVFVGDSLLAGWAKDFKSRFPGMATFDFSVGGDRTQNVIWRFQHSKLSHIKPKAVIVLIGTNNFYDKGNTGCDIYEGVKTVVNLSRKTWPKSHVFILTVPPRGADFKAFDDIRIELNRRIMTLSSIPNVTPTSFREDELTCGQNLLPPLPASVLTCFPEKAYHCSNYGSDNLHFERGAYDLVFKYLSDASVVNLGKNIFEND